MHLQTQFGLSRALNSQPMRPGANAKMTEAYIHFSNVEKENGLELVTRTRIANPKGNACKDAKDRVNQSALSDFSSRSLQQGSVG